MIEKRNFIIDHKIDKIIPSVKENIKSIHHWNLGSYAKTILQRKSWRKKKGNKVKGTETMFKKLLNKFLWSKWKESKKKFWIQNRLAHKLNSTRHILIKKNKIKHKQKQNKIKTNNSNNKNIKLNIEDREY